MAQARPSPTTRAPKEMMLTLLCRRAISDADARAADDHAQLAFARSHLARRLFADDRIIDRIRRVTAHVDDFVSHILEMLQNRVPERITGVIASKNDLHLSVPPHQISHSSGLGGLGVRS